jgi:hypothetical protein
MVLTELQSKVSGIIKKPLCNIPSMPAKRQLDEPQLGRRVYEYTLLKARPITIRRTSLVPAPIS